MSSQHQYMASNSANKAKVGDIEHIGYLSEHIGQLCLSSEYSDVTLVVEGHRIPAHKVILAASSEYFRALLYGGMRETNQAEIELQAPLLAFKALLRYVYSGHMGLSLLREETVLDILGLAHQFDFSELETAISDYLKQVLALRNVCSVLDAARLYGLESLMNYCFNFLDRHALDVLKHESFLQISIESLRGLLERDSFFAPEVEIFKAVCNWFNANQSWVKESGDTPVEEILRSVRFTLMSLEDLLRVVRPFHLVTADMLLDAIQDKTQTKSTQLSHRGQLLAEENVATIAHGAQVISGDMRTALLDGDTENYDMERGYTRHTISDSPDNGIVVQLSKPTIINHIKMLLWDRDYRSYAYYIEVSVDCSDWVRVIDHSDFYCRSWQLLYFEARAVQYIRIVGTSNTVNKVFHAVALEAMYTEEVPPISPSGLVSPKTNVATTQLSAVVIEGISRIRNTLLNGDTVNYDWEYGYTCHQLGSGAIVVQLAQPYLIGSIRMLLWDCDSRHYSYYVETSVNYWDWETVADKSREQCSSWQVIYFTPRPVSVIRVVGTSNSVNEVFHLVHLEAPAQVELTSNQTSPNSKKKTNKTPKANSTSEPSSSSASNDSLNGDEGNSILANNASERGDESPPPTETATEAEE